MSNTTDRVTTAEQLAAMPDDGKRYELVEGVLHVMSPAGHRHGRIAAKLLVRVANHVEQNELGETYAAETGFLIQRDPDTVRAPDVAFVTGDRLERYADHVGYLPLAPDLVAEIVSPSDRPSEVESKAKAWLDAGVPVVLVVDPQTLLIREYRPASSAQVHSDGFIDLNDVLPGFQLDVAELFACPPRRSHLAEVVDSLTHGPLRFDYCCVHFPCCFGRYYGEALGGGATRDHSPDSSRPQVKLRTQYSPVCVSIA